MNFLREELALKKVFQEKSFQGIEFSIKGFSKRRVQEKEFLREEFINK